MTIAEEEQSKPRAAWWKGAAIRYVSLAVLDIGSKGLAFLATISIARHYDEGTFGEFSLAQSLITYGMIVSTCGIDMLAVRQVAAGLAAPRRLGGTVAILRTLLGIATACGMIGLVCLVPQYRPSARISAIYSLVLVTGAFSSTWLAQALRKTYVIGLAQMSIQSIYLAGVQGVIYAGGPIVWIPWAMVAADGVTAAGIYAWTKHISGWPEFSMTWRERLQFLRQAAPIGAANLLRIAAIASDVLLLGLLVDLPHVGLYGAGFKLFWLGASLTIVYFTILHPVLSSSSGQGGDALRRILHRALRLTVPVSVAAAGFGMVAAEPALRILYGENFSEAAGSLRILMVVLPVYLISGHYRGVLVAVGQQRRDMLNVAVGALTHVGTKLAMVPMLGINGAAWGTLLGETVLMLLSWQAARQYLHSRAAPTNL